MLIPKDQLKALILADRAATEARGKHWEAGLNLAMLIASNALYHQRLRDGKDYMLHPVRVAFMDTNSMTRHVIGILHDVVEDSDWTLQDMRDVGFNERIIKGLDGVTKRDGEKYFDFVERCALSGEDAIEVKIKDLTHNMDQSRTPCIQLEPKQEAKLKAYNISFYYLLDIKRGDTEPGTPILEFIETMPEYGRDPYLVNALLDQFSSRPQRISPYAAGGAYNPEAPAP